MLYKNPNTFRERKTPFHENFTFIPSLQRTFAEIFKTISHEETITYHLNACYIKQYEFANIITLFPIQ